MDESIRQKILALLDEHKIMTIATVRPDDHDTPDLVAIAGLFMAARAHRVTDRAEADAPPQTAGMTMPGPDEVALFRVEPAVISVLDSTKGFAHTDLVTC